MAEGFLKLYAPHAIIVSAGIETHGVNPRAIKVMGELDIDLSKHTSDHIDTYKDDLLDHIITVCDNAQENCPYFPGDAQRHHHNFPDPAKADGTEHEILESFRHTRNMIKDWCKNFSIQYLSENQKHA